MQGPRSEAPSPSRRSTWISAAIIFVAMLAAPLLAWLVLPAPSAPSVTRVAPAAPELEAPVAPRAAPKAAGPATTTRVVAGLVRDDAGAPVAGAVVYVTGRPGQREASGDDGRFSLDDAPLDAFEIVASKEGFASGHANVDAGERGSKLEVVLRMRAQGPIEGIVLDDQGRPAPGAFVACGGHEEGLGHRTDENGRFDMEPDAEGCTAIAVHPEYGPSAGVKLVAGRQNRLELTSPGGIQGVVVDEGGAPVGRYVLAIESFTPADDAHVPGPRIRARPFEDASGAFTLEKLPAGRYVLNASTDGRPPARSGAIQVETGRVTHDVRIVLAQGATLSGVVTDADTRAPIAGARVSLDAFTGNGVTPGAMTDASGAYALAGVPGGAPFSVRFESTGYTARIVSGLVTRGAATLQQDIALRKLTDGGATTEFAGIGAVLMPAAHGVEIGGIVDDGPAAKAGLVKGDRLLRIDGASAEEMTVSECVQLLRGPEGSRITVLVARQGGGNVEVTMVRAIISR